LARQTRAKLAKYLVPQAITAARLISSSVAIFASILNDFPLAVKLITIGIIIDSFDGYVARKLQVTSEFGSLFDYYSDYLGNVVAPSIIVFHLIRDANWTLAVALASLPLLTGAIRYARNALLMKKEQFEETGYPGLGTVFFALFLVEVILLDLAAKLDQSSFRILISTAIPFFSVMMIAPWRYPKLTKSVAVNIVACSLLILHLFLPTRIIPGLVLLAIFGFAFFSPLALRLGKGNSSSSG
jgi:phosphatidylserine synthase